MIEFDSVIVRNAMPKGFKGDFFYFYLSFFFFLRGFSCLGIVVLLQ
jgi:hypothetical protein